ncbi:cytochrome P450, partial [Acetobacteraceae bacterium ESL0697]|nr:cytochrome P450 [Acetobacteraceae bacterium ESL0697]
FFFVRNAKALRDPKRVINVFRAIIGYWGDIVSFRSGLRERTYIVAEPSAGEEIFDRQDLFVKYPTPTKDIAKLQAMIGKGMLATHIDQDWERHRKSLAPDFARMPVIRRYGAIIGRHVRALIDEISLNKEYEQNISELSMRFSGRVISDILAPGHYFADQLFIDIKHILDRGILEFHRRDFVKRAKPYKAALREQALRLVDVAVRQEHHPNDGLVARMMADEPNWQHEIKARERLLDRIINMIVAGYETTATSLNWIIYLLAEHPEVQKRLREEILYNNLQANPPSQVYDENTLLQRVILEAMRLYSVLWFNIRYATKDCIVSGKKFKKGARVMLLPFLINRDARRYNAPNTFDPDRFLRGEPLPLYPFGTGPRVCIGRTLAELEMQHMVAVLVAQFDLKALNHPKAIGGVLLQPDSDIFVCCSPIFSK